MDQGLMDEAFRVAIRMAADRYIELDRTALMQALVAVAGEGDGQDVPDEIAEDALDLLTKAPGVSSSRPQALLTLCSAGPKIADIETPLSPVAPLVHDQFLTFGYVYIILGLRAAMNKLAWTNGAPAPDRVIMEKQRRGDPLAAPAVVEQHESIG